MPNSPLEIYEKAYRLHYDEGDIPGACEVYKQIISEFPESNESGYAAIQLQKIYASEVAEGLGKSSSRAAGLAIASLVLSIILLIGLGVSSYLLYRLVESESRKQSKMIRALGLTYAGSEREALRLLEEVKQLSGDDVAPFALSATIHAQRGDRARAKAEYNSYRKRAGLDEETNMEPKSIEPKAGTQIIRWGSQASPNGRHEHGEQAIRTKADAGEHHFFARFQHRRTVEQGSTYQASRHAQRRVTRAIRPWIFLLTFNRRFSTGLSSTTTGSGCVSNT